MIELVLADRYARALSETIDDHGEAENVQQDLQNLSDLFAENDELRAFAANPAIPLAPRSAALDDILSKTVECDTTRKFVTALLERGRIGLLPRATKRFAALVNQRLNRVPATVTSALPLEEKQKERIRDGLEKYCGKSVLMETKTDPAIIGGVVVEIDGKILDGGLRAQLARLRESVLAEEI